MSEYQPKTGARCGCRKGTQRDNCPSCEGAGMAIDFKAIRDAQHEKPTEAHTPTPFEVTESGKAIEIQDADGTSIAVIIDGDKIAIAQKIVRAVNAHEELLKVLYWLRAEIDENGQGILPDGLCGAMDCAIAKAGGRS